ncbi:MAG: ABC transporter substrate-binding protein [Candidatus Binatia bacterium]
MAYNAGGEFRRYVSVALVGFLLFGWAQGSWASWKSEWEKVVEAAKKEGKVVASIPASAKLRKRMEEAFEKRFAGIDLEPVPAGPSRNVRRIADEFKAGERYFDVHVSGASSMVTGLVRPGFVDPIEPYMLLPEVRDPKNWWGGHIYADKAKRFAYSFIAYLSQNIYYNTNLVNPEEIRTYDDLLNPKWKGKIGFFDPRIPGPGDASWSYMWEVKGENYLRGLVRQDLQITTNRRVLAESLAKGKLAITIGVSYYSLAPFLKAGLPMKALPIPKEGTYATGGAGVMVIVKDPPHPNATKVFVNWLLGKEGQEIFSKAMGHATRRLDVDTAWIYKLGYVPAKDALTVDDYYKHENQSEEKVQNVRIPARKFARKLLK